MIDSSDIQKSLDVEEEDEEDDLELNKEDLAEKNDNNKLEDIKASVKQNDSLE